MTSGPRALFQQFTEQLSTDNALSDQLAAWARARDEWQTNWTNRATSAPDDWIHPITDAAPELASWKGEKELAGALARAITLVQSHPASLATACAELARSGAGKSVPLAAVTPALSSLDPSKFVVICDAWLRVLGQFEGAELSKDISAYPDLNTIALRWLAAAEGDVLPAVLAGCPPADRFGVFCGWVARTHPVSANSPKFGVTKKQYKEWPPMW